jgi:predicted O-methyltransferase YrrM
MYRLTSRLLHTEMAKTAKQRLRIETENLYQAVKLIRILHRTGNVRQTIKLLHSLEKTGKLRKVIELIRSIHREDNFTFADLLPLVTPDHYYSPLPNFKQISARSHVLFNRSTAECPGIDLREEAQLELLERFSRYYNDLPFPLQPGETTRYYYENKYFGYADAIILYSVLRYYEPHHVIEIGSGFSSAAMLDVNDAFLDRKVHFTFVEPNPKRLLGLLTSEDKDQHTILRRRVQDVPLEVFHALSANDVLFVDSSHIAKVGSDVVHILFHILPELKPGVIIHFHDVFWPFEYPQQWFSWMAWNEAYFLRSFLQYNNAFEIMYFNSFIAQHHADILLRNMPLYFGPREYPLKGLNPGASLWLRKVA